VLWKQALQIDFNWYKHEIWLQSRQILTVNQVRPKKGLRHYLFRPHYIVLGGVLIRYCGKNNDFLDRNKERWPRTTLMDKTTT
jgi:hypothetical protein